MCVYRRESDRKISGRICECDLRDILLLVLVLLLFSGEEEDLTSCFLSCVCEKKFTTKYYVNV